MWSVKHSEEEIVSFSNFAKNFSIKAEKSPSLG